MSKTLRFLHCADLHLDSGFKGIGELPGTLAEDIRESTFRALDRLVEKAILHHVDFVLMVGDLFDYETRSLKAQLRLKHAFEQLNAQGIPVYISHGNHDYMNGPFHAIDYPDNVYVFSEEKVTSMLFQKDGQSLARVYGFSYQDRAMTDRKVHEYQKLDDTPFHIGMLHGSIDTNTDHDVYAPFHMKELTAQDMDYWALGHIHKREILTDNPPVVYPGNIQGRSIKETGEKGCMLVELTGTDHTLEFIPLQAFRFERKSLDVLETDRLNQLETLLTQKKEEWRQDAPSVIKLELSAKGEFLKRVDDHGELAELIDILNEQEAHETQWIWLSQHSINEIPSWDEEKLREEKHFMGEVVRQTDDTTSVNEWLEPLYRHRIARRHLDSLSLEEEEEILEEAKGLILRHLLKE